MEQIQQAIRQMIAISDSEMDALLRSCFTRTFGRKEILSHAQQTPNEVFFINKGILRVLVTDPGGTEHTVHFALENQFIADYAAFIQEEPAMLSLQALEETETVVMPRGAIEWGYQNLREGDKMGRLIAEYYFVYQSNRLRDQYLRGPGERYASITEVFPDIHSRVPQHMIASYLGITPIHLSRLKKAAATKS